MNFNKLLREPFVQFLGLGLIVFIVMSQLSDGEGVNRNIHVSEVDTERLKAMWEAQYNRAPSEQELVSIVDRFVREEILVREAMAIGLDDDDLIIRRRLAQKYEFLVDGRVDVEDPGDLLLAGWYREHAPRYLVRAEVSFRHAFFSQARPGDNADQDASQSLAQLQRDDVDWRSVGDPFMMQREFAPRSQREILDLFGTEFAEALFELPEGRWSAPVRSAYGWHAVMVVQRFPEAIPSFESIRPDVLADYLEMQRELKKQTAFAALKARYMITTGQGNEVVE